MFKTYADLPNERVSGANGVDYAYRDTGGETMPLVLLQHFRGNLDSWDPALVDALAGNRRVITFDNAGVGGSSGTTPDTIGQMARDAIAFLAAMGLSQVDLLGFSIGSFVAQEITLIRPAIASRAICPIVSGVVPDEPPTPALSNVITRRLPASASTSAGSQLSRLPRKCCSRTSGGWSPPVSR